MGTVLIICLLSCWEFGAISALYCHQCGNMYDGNEFMSVEGLDECGSHLDTQGANQSLAPCPSDERCCFVLREHISFEFWGHEAAAEVLIRGCCQKLNESKHHLSSTMPPPLATSSQFKAEVMSPTMQNGQVRARILFCNTKGCNNGNVPWSRPQPVKNTIWDTMQANSEAFGATTGPPEKNRRRFLDEDQNLALLAMDNANPRQLFPATIDDLAEEARRFSQSSTTTTEAPVPSAAHCECHCNCPSLVCSGATFLMSSRISWFIYAIVCLLLHLLQYKVNDHL